MSRHLLRLPPDERIASVLLQFPEILRMRTRSLERDIRGRFNVGPSTARAAVGIARERARFGCTVELAHESIIAACESAAGDSP